MGQILGALKGTKNAFLLDRTFDNHYNQLAVSFICNKHSVLEAMLKMASKVIALIDMRTRKASVDELLGFGLNTLDVMLRHGTTTVEVKSGYGLTTRDELKNLGGYKTLKSASCG